MKAKKHAQERLRELLQDAYRARAGFDVSENWQERLMARVREIAPAAMEPRFLPAFERLVWRLAPFTLAMSMVVMALLGRLYLTREYDGLQLLARYVEELTLKQIFGA